MIRYAAWALAALFCLCDQAAKAETEWPARPIKFVIPSAAGGSPDILARILIGELQKQLGQPILIDNKPGAAGNIGVVAVAKTAPDGYTIGYGNVNTLAVNKSLFSQLPYDVDKELTPVTLLGTTYNLLVVRSDLPVTSVAELIAYAKGNPGRISMGSGGNGTTGHLGGELFKALTDIDIIHVPYRGSPQAIHDLLGGQTQMMFDNVASIGPMVRDGRVRALGVSGSSRIDQFPNIPTIEEAGVKGYSTEAWGGVVVPKGTPEHIVERLNLEINKALRSAEVREKMNALGVNPLGSTRPMFNDFIQVETRKWAEVIKASGAKID